MPCAFTNVVFLLRATVVNNSITFALSNGSLKVYFQYRRGKSSMRNKIGTFSLEDSHESSNFVLKYEVQSPDHSAKIRNFVNPSKGYVYSFHRKTHRCTSLNSELRAKTRFPVLWSLYPPKSPAEG